MAALSSRDARILAQKVVKEKPFQKKAKQVIEKEFQDIYQNFLKAFNSHPVTQEIEAGSSASNISRTLGGVGNLYTYIGFNAGSHPIKNLRTLLEKYDIRYNTLRSFMRTTIEVPTKDEVFAATPMPWASGRSWAKGIERGISGLGQYLVKRSSMARSRSGHAIEVKGKIRSGKFSNTSYMSALLNDYYKAIKKLEKKTF